MFWRHDIQQDGIDHNDSQDNDPQNNDTRHCGLSHNNQQNDTRHYWFDGKSRHNNHTAQRHSSKIILGMTILSPNDTQQMILDLTTLSITIPS